MTAGWLLLNTSQLLGFLCVAGVVASAFRWSTARRRDFLLAFAIFLIGTTIHQVNVHVFGVSGWPKEAMVWAASARLLQIAGGILFVRAAMKDQCGEWGWITVLAAACIAAWVV